MFSISFLTFSFSQTFLSNSFWSVSFCFMRPFLLPINSSFYYQSSWFAPSTQAIPLSWSSTLSVFSLSSFKVYCICLFLSSTCFKFYESSSFSTSSLFLSSHTFSAFMLACYNPTFKDSSCFCFYSISYLVFSIFPFTNS